MKSDDDNDDEDIVETNFCVGTNQFMELFSQNMFCV